MKSKEKQTKTMQHYEKTWKNKQKQSKARKHKANVINTKKNLNKQ